MGNRKENYDEIWENLIRKISGVIRYKSGIYEVRLW